MPKDTKMLKKLENIGSDYRTEKLVLNDYSSDSTYDNYAKRTYGISYIKYKYVNGIIQNKDYDYDISLTAPAITSLDKITEGYNGNVTTNYNVTSDKTVTFSTNNGKILKNDEDTPLGQNTSKIYPKFLYNGAKYNSERKRYKNGTLSSYITPSLYYKYGNNLNNFFKLGKIANVDNETGSISDGSFKTDYDINLGTNRKNINSLEFLDTINDNNAKHYLDEFLKNSPHKTTSSAGTRIIEVYSADLIKNDNFNRYSQYDTVGDYNEIDYADVSTKSTNIVNNILNTANNVGTNHDTSYRSILIKTKQLFAENKIISNIKEYSELVTGDNDSENPYVYKLNEDETKLFPNSEFESISKESKTPFDTTINNGMRSKGRALISRNAGGMENGKSRNFCRTWTFHHQYDRTSRSTTYFNGESIKTIQEKLNKRYRVAKRQGYEYGGDYLANNTVLNSDGRVNVAPSKYDKVSLKKCMFSLENLAWKDVDFFNKLNISEEQIGPNGGRIMWFPPYDLKFNESVSANWNSTKFIGRGEQMHTYVDTERSGTLSFTLLIDHPAVVNSFNNESNKGGIATTDDNLATEEENRRSARNEILRFFAGCSLPEIKDKNEESIAEKNNIESNVLSLGDVNNTEVKIITFFNFSYGWDESSATTYTEKYKTGTEKNGNNLFFDNSDLIVESQKYAKENMTATAGTYNSLTIEDLKNTLLKSTYGPSKISKNTNSDTTGVNNASVEGDKNFYKFLNTNTYYTLADTFFATDTSSEIYTSIKNKPTSIEIKIPDCQELVGQTNGKYDDAKGKCWPSKEKSGTDCNYMFGESYSEKIFKKYCDFFKAFYNEANNEIKFINDTADTKSGTVNINPTYASGSNFKQNNKLCYAIVTLNYSKSATSTPEKNSQYETKSYDNKIKVNVDEGVTAYIDKNFIEKIKNVKQGDNLTEFANEIKTNYFKNYNLTDAQAKNIVNNLIIKFKQLDNKTLQGVTVVSASTLSDTDFLRYDNEYEFFRKLGSDTSLAAMKYKDKFKYMVPAFHSISPEGFNARLTFLHQCTRQGHTISTSDYNNTTTAGNLSFGRMPVCVLRIGDFINTRIIIKSLTIAYDKNGFQWDLNPEGIGVQPMYANVSMNIVLLGGQSLEGPISRLQNAVSFNYYANTGVYDSRSDKASVGYNVTNNYDNGQAASSTYDTQTNYKYLFNPSVKE